MSKDFDRRFNPRPDLKEDEYIWNMVLKTAIKLDNETYNVLHGFRCGGAKLIYDANNPKFKLQMKPRYGRDNYWSSKEEWAVYKKHWLMPHLDNITKIFSLVSKYLDNNYNAVIAS